MRTWLAASACGVVVNARAAVTAPAASAVPSGRRVRDEGVDGGAACRFWFWPVGVEVGARCVCMPPTLGRDLPVRIVCRWFARRFLFKVSVSFFGDPEPFLRFVFNGSACRFWRSGSYQLIYPRRPNPHSQSGLPAATVASASSSKAIRAIPGSWCWTGHLAIDSPHRLPAVHLQLHKRPGYRSPGAGLIGWGVGATPGRSSIYCVIAQHQVRFHGLFVRSAGLFVSSS